MARSFAFWVEIMALISPLCSRHIIKARGIAFLISISNLLLLYFFESNIFNLINVFFILMTVTVTTVAAAAFAATKVYEVVVAYIKAGFLSLFIVSFISQSRPFIPVLYLFLSYLISLIIVSN